MSLSTGGNSSAHFTRMLLGLLKVISRSGVGGGTQPMAKISLQKVRAMTKRLLGTQSHRPPSRQASRPRQRLDVEKKVSSSVRHREDRQGQGCSLLGAVALQSGSL